GSLAFPADAAIFGVLNKYTTIREFFADAVGGGEIPPFLCGVALRDKPVDFCILRSALRAAVSERTKLFAVIVFHDGEDSVECGEKLQDRRNVTLPEFALIDSDIRFAYQVEHGRKCTRRIQVV